MSGFEPKIQRKEHSNFILSHVNIKNHRYIIDNMIVHSLQIIGVRVDYLKIIIKL